MKKKKNWDYYFFSTLFPSSFFVLRFTCYRFTYSGWKSSTYCYLGTHVQINKKHTQIKETSSPLWQHICNIKTLCKSRKMLEMQQTSKQNNKNSTFSLVLVILTKKSQLKVHLPDFSRAFILLMYLLTCYVDQYSVAWLVWYFDNNLIINNCSKWIN